MARGELARPVPPSGEADEIGRLSFAFEEMRRALRDKLRSTESVNVDLEREVQPPHGGARAAQRASCTTRSRSCAARRTTWSARRSWPRWGASSPASRTRSTTRSTPSSTRSAPLEEAIKPMVAERGRRRGVARRGRRAGDAARGPARRRPHQGDRAGVAQLLARRRRRAARAGSSTAASTTRWICCATGCAMSASRSRSTRACACAVHAGQINQVFMNLLTNAAQAVGERDDGGTIRIATRGDGRRRRDHGRRQRPRHPAPTCCREIFDPVLHHQGRRRGLRPRPVDRARHRRAPRRPHHGREPARARGRRSGSCFPFAPRRPPQPLRLPDNLARAAAVPAELCHSGIKMAVTAILA